MNVEAMLDANVLVYAASTTPDEAAKCQTASRLLKSGTVGISGQVVQEFYVTVTQKGKLPLTPTNALDWVDLFSELPCVPVDVELVRSGAEIAHRYQISYWDGAVLAAAHRLNASILYTEDLNHDQTYGSVRVVNPFRAS